VGSVAKVAGATSGEKIP